ncbi:MAG: ComEC/Rec2 family competence protein, partial [Alicyclobacillus sp.]|nr:ComEC/Rec2 family competence protein [Alicyclobacillus sp.]
GLLHVLAASGANVVLLSACAERVIRPLFRHLRLPNMLWPLLMISILWWFGAMCSFAPSITRAVWMASYQYAAQATGRIATLRHGLLFAGTAMAFQSPEQALSIGSLLSFAATAALARAVRSPGPYIFTQTSNRAGRHRWIALMRHGLLSTWTIVRRTLAVELLVSPLTLATFHQVTLYSVITNLTAEPLLAVLLPLAALFMCLALGCLYVPAIRGIAHLVGFVVFRLIAILRWLVGWMSAWPHAIVYVNNQFADCLAAAGGCAAIGWLAPAGWKVQVYHWLRRRLRTVLK